MSGSANGNDLPPMKPQKKEWTVAIYMVADGPSGNSALDAIAARELLQILAAAAPHKCAGSRPIDKIYVAVQVDFSNRSGIFRLSVDGDFELLPSEDSASTKSVKGFFDWVTKECPSEHRLVMFWGHSSGPVGLFGDRRTPTSPMHRLTLPQIRGVMQHLADSVFRSQHEFGAVGISKRQAVAHHGPGKGGLKRPVIHPTERNIDIVVFKDCWMSTLEAAHELKGLAKYMIASPAKVPQIGWPHDKVFDCLNRAAEERTTDIGRVAREVIERLEDFYALARNREDKDEVPYVLVDLNETDHVRRKLDAFVTELGARPNGNRVQAALDDDALTLLEGASRGDPALLDLLVMSERARNGYLHKPVGRHGSNGHTLAAAAKALGEAVKRAVVHRRPDQSAFGGLSVFYYPTDPLDVADSLIAPLIGMDRRLYEDLAFANEDTKWTKIALAAAPSNEPVELKLMLKGHCKWDTLDSAKALNFLVALLVARVFKAVGLVNGNGQNGFAGYAAMQTSGFVQAAALMRSLGLGQLINFDEPKLMGFAQSTNLDEPKLMGFGQSVNFDEPKLMGFANPIDFANALDFASSINFAAAGNFDKLNLGGILSVNKPIDFGDGGTPFDFGVDGKPVNFSLGELLRGDQPVDFVKAKDFAAQIGVLKS